MSFNKLLSSMVVLVMLVGFGQADTLNYDPALPAPAPVLDAGWASDRITARFADSADSPYLFALLAPAYFRITDAFVVGDTFFVYNGASLILTTALGTPAVRTAFGDNSTADAAWVSSTYQHGEILLGPGSYSLRVQGDGAGGIPAGFYTRLDSAAGVPEPSTLVALLGMALLGAFSCWRLRK